MKRLALIVPVIAAAAVAWFALSRGAQVSEPSVVAGPACAFRVGEQRAWRVRSVSNVRLEAAAMGLGVAPGPLPVTKLESTGLLQVEVIEPGVLLARFADVDAQTRAQLGADIGAPFLLRVAPDCALTGFARLNGSALGAARGQQALAYELWFEVPAGDPVTVASSDSAGRYQAIVARDGSTVRRRKLQYTAQWPNPLGAKGALEIREALLTVQRDDGLWFASMSGHAAFTGEALSRAETSLQADAQPARTGMFDGAPREVSRYVWEDLLPTPVAPPEPPVSVAEQRARSQLAVLPLDGALERFAARIESGVGFNQQWPELRDYLEARPDQISPLAEALVNGDLPAEAQPAAYLAIGKARVPEARDALLAINRNERAAPMHRLQTALLLADRSDTPPAFASELRTASVNDKTYGPNAALALGMFAARQGARDEKIVSEARAAIADLLTRGTTAAELSPAFGAMGNLGDPSLLPDLETWSRNADADVRAAATLGLRRLKVDVETPLLREWLQRETHPTVRRELWSVLYRQLNDEQRELPDVFVATAIAELRGQPGLLTRQPLVRILAPLAKRDAQVKQALLDQVNVEVGSGSGLMDVLSGALPGADVASALRAQAP